MKFKILTLIMLFILFSPSAFAEGVKITREIQDDIVVGNPLTIKLIVTNNQIGTLNMKVEERIADNFELVNPNEPTTTKIYNGLNVSFLDWEVELSTKEAAQLVYTVVPKQAGDVTLSPTKATDKSTGALYMGDITLLDIRCNMNKLCESGENYLNCAQDCPSGSADGVCDYVADSICDPDCTDDPDCSIFQKIDFTTIFIIVVIVLIVLGLFKVLKKKEPQFKV